MIRPAAALLLCTAFFLTGAAPAVAEEADGAVALLAQLAELRKAEDIGGLTKALAKVPAAYQADETSGTRGKLRGELGKVLKDKDLGDARGAAVAALVALQDPKPAWKELSRHLPGPKTEKPTPLEIQVVKAAGTLAQTRAVKPLIELAYKAKAAELAAAAVQALGGYGKDLKGRTKILEELITIGKRTRPGRSTEKAVSQEAQDRWAAMGPVLVKSLNELTGRNISSFEDWEELWGEYKKRPKDLFQDE